MSGVPDVLGSLGERQRDGSWKIELGGLRLASVFGGTLAGGAVVVVAGDSASFVSPPELSACGKMWMPDVKSVDAFRNAIVEAHGQVRERVNEGVTTLRRLGFKAKLQAPEPRPRGHVQIDQRAVVVALDQNGDLVVEEVNGKRVPPEQRRALIAPDEATPDEAQRRVTSLVQAFWKRHGTGPGAVPVPAGTAAAVPALSQAELDELQAALSDDDDPLADSEEEVERTATNVPPPSRPISVGPARAMPSSPSSSVGRAVPAANSRRPELSRSERSSAGFDDDDEGTLQMAAQSLRPTRNDEDDDLVGTVEVTRPPPPARPPVVAKPPARDERKGDDDGGSLLDAFDDDEVPDDNGPDSDISVDERSSADDEEEPTATSPRALDRQTAAAPAATATGGLRATGNDEENDLLAALDSDSDVNSDVNSDDDRREQLSLDDFPALDMGAPVISNQPTSVNAPPLLGQMPSAAPTQALLAPMMNQTQQVDEADGFDDGISALSRRPTVAQVRPPPKPAQRIDPPRMPVEPEPDPEQDFDGKTRALSVDAELLERLKRGDVELRRTEPDRPPPQRPPDPPPPVRAPGADDDGFDEPMPLTAASGEDDPIARPVEPPRRPPSTPPQPTQHVSSDDDVEAGLADLVDDANNDVGADVDDDVDAEREAEIVALEARAEELSAELGAVRERIAALQAARESTSTRPRAVRQPASMTATRPVNAQAGITVAATQGGPPNLDDVRQFDVDSALPAVNPTSVTPPVATPPRAPKPKTGFVAVAAAEAELRSIGQSADDSAEGDTNAPPAPVPGGTSLPSLASVDVEQLNDEEGVSLADLQGALKEMGVEIEAGGGETQVAAAVMPIGLQNDDGDVFGNSGGSAGDSFAGDSDPSQEATRIRPSASRPSTIALVVEDARARDRLRKHLEPRFAEVVDADSARAIAGNRELSRVDAIVFVRPSPSEPNRAGFARLDNLPRRPRVLVISADAVFDDTPAVDLRLPLGQKASEVAKQVLEGLERLGVTPQQV